MNDAQDDLYEVAADWVDRLDELTPQEQRNLAEWLAASTANAEAFAAMRHVMQDTALLEAAGSSREEIPPLPDARVPGARRHLSMSAKGTRASGRSIGRREAIAAGLAGLVAVPLASYWLTRESGDQPLRYASAIGQRRTIALPDGSTMTLDAASRVALNFAGQRRTVHLEQGAAHFDVRHDPSRPFEVFTPQARMEALGTRFSVDRLARTSELRVYEGRVGLDTGFDRRRVLPAREWAMVGDKALIDSGTFDPAAGHDWQNDWLDAQAMPLGQALERLGRYSEVPLRLAEPDMAALTFSGRFRLNDPRRSLELIGSLFAMHLDHRDKALVLVRDGSAART